MVPGTSVNICMNEAMVQCRADNESDGQLANTVDLQCFLDSNPGADGLLELEANDAETWINSWGSDLETHEAFFLSTTCVGDAAMKIVASGAAVLAVAATL